MPSEALKLTGEYIENLIPGYRTLHVSGRELLGCEIEDYEIGNMDGTQYRGKRYPPRVITVTYQLITGSDTAFRNAFNKLNGLLDVEEAELIFYDEPDKYFIGTKASNSTVTAGVNSVVGEIEFYCTDPFKYSTVEKQFDAELNAEGIMELTLHNEGTVPAAIDYEIEHNHENGYIGIASEYGAMQYGNVDERDVVAIKNYSEMLVNYKSGDDFNLTKGGVYLSPYINDIDFRKVTYHGIKFLEVDGSSVQPASYWHGAGGYVKIPADSNGHIGAKNFKATAKIWFQGQNARQRGGIDFCISKGNDIIASFQIWDGNRGAYNTYVDMFVGKSKKGRYTYDATESSWSGRLSRLLSYRFGSPGIISIQKIRDLFMFEFGSCRYQYRVPSMVNIEADQINIFLSAAYEDTYKQMTWACIEQMSFRTDNVMHIYDIPNRYQEGNVITIDGKKGKFYVDGIPHLEDEIVGTRYFKAPPGDTTVQFAYSDFSDPPPSIKAKIREVYI